MRGKGGGGGWWVDNNDFPGIEISIAGGVEEMVCGPNYSDFFHFFIFSLFFIFHFFIFSFSF